MPDRIFYSWQSDCPTNLNRNFILNALGKSVRALKREQDTEIDEVIDRDTIGLSGSPDIGHSIFAKIDKASIFVCDVSIINNHSKDRLTPNPNVLIELGYAAKAIGWQRIVLVMNKAFGGPEDLPFDLRLRRTIVYELSSDAADKPTINTDLDNKLKSALKSIFQDHGAIGNRLNDKIADLVRPSDKLLFEKLKQTLPSNGSIKFLNDQNMEASSWPLSSLDQLQEFCQDWIGPEHEFLDEEFEKHKQALHALISQYLRLIAEYTFPARHFGQQTVAMEWREQFPHKFKEAIKELHSTAELVVSAHNKLIRTGRRKFE